MELVTKYLVRIWPAGDEPPQMQQSEMSSPESAVDGQAGNDRAMVRSIRNWAQQHANDSAEPYCYEVCRDSMIAALADAGSNRVVEPIASGTLDPVPPPALAAPVRGTPRRARSLRDAAAYRACPAAGLGGNGGW